MRRFRLPEAVIAVARSQNWVVTRAQAEAAGVTAARWRSGHDGRLVILMRGVAFLRVPGGPQEAGPAQRAQAALLSAGGQARLCCGSVLRLHSVSGTPRGDIEHVLVGDSGWQLRAGLARHCFDVAAGDLVRVSGMRATSLTRATCDALRVYDRAHAVSVLDSALRSGRVDPERLGELAEDLGRERRGWLDLADPLSESPFETRARLFFLDNGLEFRSQVPVDLPGYGKARLDFLLGDRTVVECDGREAHDPLAARYRDRKRDEALRALGCEVIHLAWDDLLPRNAASTLERILAALRRTG